MYSKRYLLLRMDSCDYGHWLVQNLHCRLADWRPRTADRVDQVQKQTAGEFPLAQGMCLLDNQNKRKPTIQSAMLSLAYISHHLHHRCLYHQVL